MKWELDIDLPVKGSFAQCPSSNLTHQSCATFFLMLILFGDFGGGGKLYRWFTLKSPSMIYPKSSVWFGGVNRTDDLPSNHQVRFTPNRLYDLGGVNHTDDLPSNHQVQFTPNRLYDFVGGKSYRRFTLKSPSTIYPKSSVWFTLRNRQERFTPQIVCTTYPPQIIWFWAKFQTHNIMLCFTKVFSAKDQKGYWDF